MEHMRFAWSNGEGTIIRSLWMIFAFIVDAAMWSKLGIPLVLVLGLVTSSSAAEVQGSDPDPLTVVKRFFEATTAGAIDRAMVLVGDDPVFVNTQGVEGRGQDAMLRFAQTLVRENAKIDIITARVEGNKVIWRNTLTTFFYQKLGVTPIEVNYRGKVSRVYFRADGGFR
jgi:hypothetical protein